MSGHLFATRGDLTRLSCDAWLLPTDSRLNIVSGWLSSLDRAEATAIREAAAPAGWHDDSVRSFAVNEATGSASRPWLTNLGSYDGQAPEWFLQGAREFLDRATNALRQETPVAGRDRPLLGMPLVGTGQGGAEGIAGDIVAQLVTMLTAWCSSHDADVVVVTRSDAAFAAVQAARKAEAAGGTFADLPDDVRANAQRLAEYAVDGRLVLFLGAGVSKAAGLPDWNELLGKLAESAGIAHELRKELADFNELDYARILATRYEAKGENLGKKVANEITAPRYSLLHAMLGSLPTSEVVTTNYDELFEKASRDAGVSTAVIPYEPTQNADRWLLKLHGCVNHTDDIVLTRTDYLRYGERRAALAGIVQAMLMTRHILFLGFSLRDDNFHRIVDEVRRAIPARNGSKDRFGTVLVLEENALREELWKEDLAFVSLKDDPGEKTAGTARRGEILVDLLLLAATNSSSHLLESAYDGILTDAERRLRDRLRALRADLTAEELATDAGRRLASLYAGLGSRETAHTQGH